MTERVGFIGLGIMGMPMARNLMDSGYELTVHNRSPEKAEELGKKGAVVAATRMSQSRARWNDPPIDHPLQATITGASSSHSCWIPR